MEPLAISPERVSGKLRAFIRQRISEAGSDRAIVALSGGIDSSTTVYLAQRALGAENVWGVNMPYRTSSPQSASDAQLVAHELGINFLTIEITDMIDAYFKRYPDADRLRRGNKMARERMTILYDQSAALRALVLGSGNKTELLLGYCTLYGDTACALAPLGDLYKTQVRELSRFLGVPEGITQKVPTADLWPGQSDEAELGFTYEEVDKLLYFMVEKKYTSSELKRLGFTDAFIEQVTDRIRKSQYKRRLPLIPRINQGFVAEKGI
jgi:NAD+ synthase